MDKRTIKSLIIELKEENKSFQEISDILAREYGVKMSRQAVCGMYKRATSDDAINNNRNIILATTDIVNYSALGMPESIIKETLNNRGIDVSLNKVKSILKDNSNYLDEIYNELLKRMSWYIEHGYDLEDIKSKLQFKGVKPTESLLKSLIYSYHEKIYHYIKRQKVHFHQ